MYSGVVTDLAFGFGMAADDAASDTPGAGGADHDSDGGASRWPPGERAGLRARLQYDPMASTPSAAPGKATEHDPFAQIA